MPAPHLKILIAEDSAADAELEVRVLKQAGLNFEYRVVEDEAGFRAALVEFVPDVILSDFSMPRFDGLAALAIARELSPDTPFIFVSGTMGETYAIEALKSGAADYVLKNNLMRLGPAVERAWHNARERAARRKIEAELAAARERLESIVTSLQDVVWSVGLPSREVLYVSPAARGLFGRSPEELAQRPDLRFEAVHPEDRQRVTAAWEAFLAGGVYDLEYRIVGPEGGIRWIHDRARTVVGPDGSPVRIDGIARDITERMEQHLRLLRLGRIREMLSGINAAIVRIRDRQGLFDAVTSISTRQGGFCAAWVGMPDDAARDVKPVAVRGLPGGFFEGLKLSSLPGADWPTGLAEVAAQNRDAVVANDLEARTKCAYAQRALAAGARSAACLPLTVEGKVVAVMVLHAAEAGFFDREEVRLLKELAVNISFALELMAKNERIDYLAFYDALTGLANRTLFQERLADFLASAREGERVALALIDIDRFKLVNDTLGMPGGDEVLKKVAARLTERQGDPKAIGRIGGDLFAVAVHPVRDESELLRLGEAVLDFLEIPFEIEQQELRLTAKAGIAVSPSDGTDAETLFRNAEAALKKAKRSGDRYLFYAPTFNARASEQLTLETRLRRAVEREEFTLFYQPKVSLEDGAVVGLEALLRWNDPETGLVPPLRFISLLEETGLILAVGRWAFHRAASDFVALARRLVKPTPIAVNVSALQLRQPDFVRTVEEAVKACAPFGCGIELEITESMVMQDVQQSILRLKEVRELGPAIAMDDFGTGYSSLSYLSKLPLDAVKIDRSFIVDMTGDAESMSVVSAIISLAHGLGLKVIAEGVETEDQSERLRRLHCDQIQGYVFSPPVPLEQVLQILTRAQNR